MTAPTTTDLRSPSRASGVADTDLSDAQSLPCVLFIVDQLTELGGGERSLFEIAKGLPAFGYRSLIVTFRDDPAPAAYALCDNITILPLASCFSFKALFTALQLRRIILREHVTVVHTFFESSDIFGAVVARISGVKHLISSRRDMGILRSSKHKIAYRLLAPLYSAVITVSDTVRDWHRQTDKIAEDRIKTIHNGLARDRLQPRQSAKTVRDQLGVACTSPLVTTISNINPWKGVDVFVSTAAIVLKQHPGAMFAVAGDWTDMDHLHALQAAASTLGISDRMLFLGRVDDIAALLLASDVFALLSRSEGMPNVVLEAMAAGLPVVATAVGGTPEVVVNGITGYLVPNEDSEAAAERIGQLISDPYLRARIGDAGITHIHNHFSLEKMIRSHVDLYDSLLARQSKEQP